VDLARSPPLVRGPRFVQRVVDTFGADAVLAGVRRLVLVAGHARGLALVAH
jgi:hypothetical protein